MEVNRRFAETMRNFERLRVIYDTTKTMVDRAIYFGDAHSGWHQLEQAQWYEEKRNMTQSFRNTHVAYRRKLAQYEGDLLEILEDFGQCEAQSGGMEDWFERWGLLFYQLIRTQYDRT